MLKKIHFLKDLPEHILQKISEIAHTKKIKADQSVYKQDEIQTSFYMLVSGKVVLESRSSKGITMVVDEVLPGRILGVPSLLQDSKGSFTAVCAQPSTLIVISGKEMRQLFTDDYEIGHIVMRKMVEMYKLRRDMHTQQFIQSLKTHPEIQALNN